MDMYETMARMTIEETREFCKCYGRIEKMNMGNHYSEFCGRREW